MSKILTKLFISMIVMAVTLIKGYQLPYSLRFLQPANSQSLESDSLSVIEQSIYQQVNQYRQSRGLPPLVLNSRISEQSRIHSQMMAQGKVPFSHDGFKLRIETIAKSIPYRSAAENVAFNSGYADPATEAVQGWIKSEGHRRNMEGNFNLTGIGVAKNAAGEYYFTQIFILQR